MNRFQNGFDSFKKSIICLEKDYMTEFDLKDIVINFHHSIEVLFKEILYNESPFYIYKNIDEKFDHKFKHKVEDPYNRKNTKNFTISFDETIRRVIVICRENIDQYTYNRFKTLNDFRNSLTHDEFDLLKEDVDQLVVSLLPTVIMVLQKYLPEENRKKIDTFIREENVSKKLKQLYERNRKWRLGIILNLLTTYNIIEDELTISDKAHIERILSLLGCQVYDDDMETLVDNKLYPSLFSYLENEVIEYMIYSPNLIDKYIKNDQSRELINKNKIIKDICYRYVRGMANHLIKIIEQDEGLLISLVKNCKDGQEANLKVNEMMSRMKLINKLHINEVFNHIGSVSYSYVYFCDKKKSKEEFLKRIELTDYNINVEDIYSIFSKWFKDNNWYSNGELNSKHKELGDALESYDLSCKNKKIDFNDHSSYNYLGVFHLDTFSNLIGEWGNLGLIDNIYFEDEYWLVTVIDNTDIDNSYQLIYNADIPHEFYMGDKEYYSDGSTCVYITSKVTIEPDGDLTFGEGEYIGRMIEFDDLL